MDRQRVTKPLATLCLAVAAVLWFSTPVLADVVYGRVYIGDQPQGSKTLALRDSNNNPAHVLVTDGNGNFSVFLAPGTYRIEFNENGATWVGTIESYPQPAHQDIYLKKR
jgi:hypothetical protein